MTRSGKSGSLPAALTTAVGLCILISLGVWQLQRRTWKLGILAAIDRAEISPAIPLIGIPPQFSKVVARGALLPQKALYGVDVREDAGGQPHEGAQLIGILTRPALQPVVVDLGWVQVADGVSDPLARPELQHYPITIDGYVRPPDHSSWLSAADDPAARHFYTLDPAHIAAALGVRNVAPFTLIAMGKPDTPGAPVPAVALPRPPNNHLQYAFTWFGLAGSLAAVFVAWAREAGKSKIGDDNAIPLKPPSIS